MRAIILALLPFVLSAQPEIESTAMLYQAGEIARRFGTVLSRAAPPASLPQTEPLLNFASNWFVIDLDTLKIGKESVLASLSHEKIWESLREIGIQAVELKGLKLQDGALINLKINPTWGTDAEYAKLASIALQNGIKLIGSTIGESTGKGADFALALKNYADYPGLYSLVEIETKDWTVLPKVEPNSFAVNVPWLTLQTLHKMGYVSKDYNPYVKISEWNVTEPIVGIDGKTRRWIYLRDAKGNPKLDWLRPSFAAERLAAGDALQSVQRLGQKIFVMDGDLSDMARTSLSLLVRKLGAFSAAHVNGGVASFKEKSADVLYDHLTPIAVFHAIITEDAEALRLLYRLLQEEAVQPKTLVHALAPFRGASSDWAEFLSSPRKKYQYYEQELTGEMLRRRLLNEDIFHMTGEPSGETLSLSTWPNACSTGLSFEDIDTQRPLILQLHLLLTKFFAWQPGVFSLSAEDLMGATSSEKCIDLTGYNGQSLYPCLASQMKQSGSYALELRKILKPRRDYNLATAELIDVPPPIHQGVLLLRYKLPNNSNALLAINFSRSAAIERFDDLEYKDTTAINLETSLTESKFFDSTFFELKLDPLSAKLILFQPTYYKK